MTVDAHKLLWLGCGELARQALPLINHYSVTGLSRRYKPFLEPYNFVQANLAEGELAPVLAQQNFSAIVITLAPDSYSAEAYRTTYWLNSQYIVQQLPENSKPLLVFVSSTSVYQQSDGEWVNEDSPTQPENPAAQWLLKAEEEIAQSGCPFCILRPSGIYGPGRDFLLRQVLQGIGGGEQFTNRIHSLDLARLLAFILERHRLGQPLPSYLLASDDLPVTSKDIRLWLADALGLDPKAPITAAHGPLRGGNKRVSNRVMRELGFQLTYPTYLDGYLELCQQEK